MKKILIIALTVILGLQTPVWCIESQDKPFPETYQGSKVTTVLPKVLQELSNTRNILKQRLGRCLSISVTSELADGLVRDLKEILFEINTNGFRSLLLEPQERDAEWCGNAVPFVLACERAFIDIFSEDNWSRERLVLMELLLKEGAYPDKFAQSVHDALDECDFSGLDDVHLNRIFELGILLLDYGLCDYEAAFAFARKLGRDDLFQKLEENRGKKSFNLKKSCLLKIS